MFDHLEERIAESERLQRGQEAESYGLRAARVFDRPYPYSRDAYLQQRFELGFSDGKSLLAIERRATATGGTDGTGG